MVLLENGEVVTDEEDGYEGMPPLEEDEADSSEELLANEQLGLVVRRVLATQIKEEDGQQKENIFYTCCHIFFPKTSFYSNKVEVQSLVLWNTSHPSE